MESAMIGNPGKRNKKGIVLSRVANNYSKPVYPFFPNLPDDVVTNIFSFLPVKQAIQVSTLSPRFMEAWKFSRKLCFEEDFAKRFTQKELFNIIDRIFQLHKGESIETFSLCFDPTGMELKVEDWIQTAIDKGVEVLELNFSLANMPYKISPNFQDDIDTIRSLKLCRCELELLPGFQGLNSLQTLVLKKIEINPTCIETLLSNCMSLESLVLIQCRKVGRLKIFAQNLRNFKALKVANCADIHQIDVYSTTMRTLHYSGKLIAFQFFYVFQLTDVIFNFKPLRAIRNFFKKDSFLYDLPRVAVLSTSSALIEDLSPGLFDNRALGLCFTNLRELQLLMAGAAFCNLYDIAFFVDKCPRLEKLFIDLNGFNFETGDYWEQIQRPLVEQPRQFLRSLKFIKLVGFKFEDHEIEVVKYLLARAVVLDTLILVAPKTAKQGITVARNIPICQKICTECAISPVAKTIYYCADQDISPGPMHSKTWYEQY